MFIIYIIDLSTKNENVKIGVHILTKKKKKKKNTDSCKQKKKFFFSYSISEIANLSYMQLFSLVALYQNVLQQKKCVSSIQSKALS